MLIVGVSKMFVFLFRTENAVAYCFQGISVGRKGRQGGMGRCQ